MFVLSICLFIPVGVFIIGTLCLLITDGTVGRLLAEVGRINKLAEDAGRSRLLIASDTINKGFDDPNAFAATWSAALTAAAVLWDLNCEATLIPGLTDLFLELALSRYVSVRDLFLDCRLPSVVSPSLVL